MKRTVTALEARRKLGELLEGVSRGDEVVIERSGKVMGVVIPIERYQQIQAARQELLARIEAASGEGTAMSEGEIERLVAEEIAAHRREQASKKK